MRFSHSSNNLFAIGYLEHAAFVAVVADPSLRNAYCGKKVATKHA